MRATALVLAIGSMLAVAAWAADVDEPVWTQAPSRDDWAKAYPSHAAQAGIAGRVKLRCGATPLGALTNCAVIEETPVGEGFGAAALSLTGGMEMKPATADGRSVAGRNFIVPVSFQPEVLKAGGVITEPDWVRAPKQEELIQYYPAEATPKGGRAVIHCEITKRGLMAGCALLQESPTGHGYGAAALAMTDLFVMRPMTVDGQPVAGSGINIPIKFEGGAPAPGATTRVLGNGAPWIAAPSAAQMAAAYPKSAIGKVTSGHVVMRCAVRSDGGLHDCQGLSELPEGHGFADAADSLIKDFRLPAGPGSNSFGNLRIDVPFDFRDPSHAAPPVEIDDPIWIRQVPPEGLVKLFPGAAIKAGYRSGRASLECSVAGSGRLTDCVTVTEDPAGFGFADAALVVAHVMQMSPWSRQGAPVEGAKIVLPIRFELPENAQAPASTSPAPAGP